MKYYRLTLVWQQLDEDTLMGYIPGDPGTTLFLISAVNLTGNVRLHGAFVPDEDEAGKVYEDSEKAKIAALHYMQGWVEDAVYIMEGERG